MDITLDGVVSSFQVPLSDSPGGLGFQLAFRPEGFRFNESSVEVDFSTCRSDMWGLSVGDRVQIKGSEPGHLTYYHNSLMVPNRRAMDELARTTSTPINVEVELFFFVAAFVRARATFNRVRIVDTFCALYYIKFMEKFRDDQRYSRLFCEEARRKRGDRAVWGRIAFLFWPGMLEKVGE